MHAMHSTYDRYYAYCSYADIRNFSYYSRVLLESIRKY